MSEGSGLIPTLREVLASFKGAVEEAAKNGDIGGAMITGIVFLGASIGFAVHYSDWHVVICGMCGAALGWITGLLTSPYSWKKDKFSGWPKGLAGFVTGTLFSKVTDLFGKLTEPDKKVLWDEGVLRRAGMFFLWFLV
jgi:hypothetical protein